MNFPTTKWTELSALRNGSPQSGAALDSLAGRYRGPIVAYFFIKVRNHELAQDLCQEFIVVALARDFFARADKNRGRFRDYLRSSIDRFLIDYYRRLKVRTPEGGFVIPDPEKPAPEPVDPVTPEDVFRFSWIHNVIARAVARVQEDLVNDGRADDSHILNRYIIRPCLEGDERPSLQEIADDLHLTRKVAENRLGHARERLKHFLLEEVELYSLSEDETREEIADLYRTLSAGDQALLAV